MNRLSRRFYSRDALNVARAILGRKLVHDSGEGLVVGRIVEAEAYKGKGDPGSHAFRGKTPRNATMFGPPGHLYVYLTYGMHYCANVVCERDGEAGAVLLRAVEPLVGIDIMAKRRGTDKARLLARGPARLTQAFGIGKAHDGEDLVDGAIWIEGRQVLQAPVSTSRRIGVESSDHCWRFYEEGPWVC